MLNTLSIKNFVLIRNLEINFKSGFTAILGETGAGKSLILEAIYLIMGKKASIFLKNNNKDKAVITGTFTITPNLASLLSDNEYEIDDELVIKRVIDHNNKSRFYLNDQVTSNHFINQISPYLITGHSQLERFLSPNTQLKILDYKNQELLAMVRKKYKAYLETKQQIKALEVKIATRDKTKLTSQINELSQLELQENEEEELIAKRQKLNSQLKCQEDLTAACQTCSQIEQNMQQLQLLIEKLDINLEQPNLKKDFNQAYIEFQEVSYLINSSNIEYNYQKLEEVENRIVKLRSLGRKYNCISDDLVNLQTQLQTELQELEEGQSRLDELQYTLSKQKQEYEQSATALSNARQIVSRDLTKRLQQHFIDLHLSYADLKIEFNQLDESKWAENGYDMVEFLFKSNKGVNYGPIDKIASGGEYARVTLALKIEINNETSTLIFDEIDSGTSGIVANSIGAKLRLLGEKSQVIAISHSPQVVSSSHNQIKVIKTHQTNQSIVNAISLTNNDKTEAIAQMFAGSNISQQALKVADDMQKSTLNTNTSK